MMFNTLLEILIYYYYYYYLENFASNSYSNLQINSKSLSFKVIIDYISSKFPITTNILYHKIMTKFVIFN